MEQKTTPRNRDEEEIMGYRDILNTIHERYNYISIRSSHILQLHRDSFQYSEKSIGGRFKSTQNDIAKTMPDSSQKARFIPLVPYETGPAIDEICDSFNKVIDLYDIDQLVLIPIFINDFLCIRPSNDGNGRMLRFLTTLSLYRCGYVIGRYIRLESTIEKTRTKYYDVLEKSGENWHEGKNNPIPFIKYLLGIILSTYKDFETSENLKKRPFI